MKHYLTYLALFLLVFSTGCSDSEGADVNNPDGQGPVTEVPEDPERVDYQLVTANASGVTGTASFIPNDDGTTVVYIELQGATDVLHPATINFGDIQTGGSIAITLETCECQISETTVTQLDNGTPITFVELMTFDGHMNIYESPTDGTVIAQTNIGSNAF